VSYGSNHPKNLILACDKCNSRKKHKILKPPFL
jgi:5-methylcytosine-specific restriction endonuclease McrA